MVITLFVGYARFKDWVGDPNKNEQVNTAGMIAALELTRDGYKAVIFDADGKKTVSDGYEDGKEDRGLAFSANGSQIYLSSNRRDAAYKIYRWRPIANKVELRTEGARSVATPYFSDLGDDELDRHGLVIVGGTVCLFEPTKMALYRVLPPGDNEAVQGPDGGPVSLMSLYDEIGSSFKKARYSSDRSVMFVTMRREGGEVFVINSLTPGPEGQRIPPMPLLAGDKVDFTISDDGKKVLVSIHGFQFPNPKQIPEEFLVDGKTMVPYRNAMFMIHDVDPTTFIPMFVSMTDDIAISEPTISPDGMELIAVAGKVAEEGFQSNGLVIGPMIPTPPGQQQSLIRPLIQVPSMSPRWAPTGDKFVYLNMQDGKRRIYVANKDGSDNKMISDPEFQYRSPIFSPQK